MTGDLNITLDLLGVVARVEVPEGPVASVLRGLLGDFPPSTSDPDHRVTVDGSGTVRGDDGTPVAEGRGSSLAVASTLWHLTQLAGRTRERAVLHAAVVGRGGQAVLLLGPPGAGKSTLAAALVLDGWSLLSDELAGLDLAGELVHHFRRPVALSADSLARLPPVAGRGWEGPESELHLRFDELRPGSASPALPAAASVFVRYRPGATGGVRAMARAQALAGLAQHAVNLPIVGTRGFAALADLARRCPAYLLDVDDVDAAVDQVAVVATAELGPARAPRAETIHPTGGLVALDLDGEGIVFDPRTGAVHHLSREAALVWRLALAHGDLQRVIGEVGRLTGRRTDEVSADISATACRLRDLGLLGTEGSSPPADSGDSPRR